MKLLVLLLLASIITTGCAGYSSVGKGNTTSATGNVKIIIPHGNMITSARAEHSHTAEVVYGQYSANYANIYGLKENDNLPWRVYITSTYGNHSWIVYAKAGKTTLLDISE